MKKLKTLVAASLILMTLAGPSVALAADKPATANKKVEKAKPYPLDKCVVSDEKLGEMGDPYVFVQEGQQVKLCCKSCLKDFKKDPAKYMKKIKAAEKKKEKK